jgi:hypothetical protein
MNAIVFSADEWVGDHWMYTTICSMDVCWRTTGRTLIDSTPYSMNNTWTYTQKYTDVCYFLEYPLDNTWTYETAFGPLCNSTGCTQGLSGDVRYFSPSW